MKKLTLIFSLVLAVSSLTLGQNRDTITVMTYNLLNFPDGRNDCGTNIQPVNRYDTLQKILEYVKPDVLLVNELHASGESLILDSCLNVNGVTYYSKAVFANNPTPDVLHVMMYYNSNKLGLKKQSSINTGSSRYVGEYLAYFKDPNLATHNDTTFVDFYECHLKAGNLASDQTERNTAATAIRNWINANSAGVNVIGGDFNVYTNAETAYQTLTNSGTYPFNDPISREGAWNNNCAYADVHTQSTRAAGTTFVECGSDGGIDDRFDFLLISDTLIPTINRVHFVSGSYTALGNNGSTCNMSINDPANSTSVPDSILNALYFMSDHLPVILKLAAEFPNPNCTDPAPTQQDSMITFSNVAGSSMTVNWSLGNGSERIVVMNTTNSFTDPVNGIDPIANPVYGGSGEQVIYNGPNGSVNVSGLSASTEYWFRVYDYSCAGDSIRFNTNTAPNNPMNQTSGSCAPILEDYFSSGMGLWQNTASWAALAGELKHNVNTAASDYTFSDFTLQDFTTASFEWEVCMRNGAWDPSMSNYFGFFLLSNVSNLLGTPNGYAVGVDFTKASDELMLYRVDGGVYTSILTLPQSTFDWNASSDVCLRITRSELGVWELFYNINGAGEFSAGTVTETTYTTGRYAGPVFTHTTGPSDDLYYDNVLICKRVIPPCSDPAPSLQDSMITFSPVEGNSLTLSWTEGNGIGRVVMINTVNSFTTPTDGTSPAANTVYSGSGEQVVFNDTSGNSVTVTGLDPSTTYWVRVFAFSCTGDSIKYSGNTATNNPVSQMTTCHGVLYSQNFDGSGNWPINSGGLFVSNAPGFSDFSPNNERILSGGFSWQVINNNGTLGLDPVSTIGYDSVVIKARVSAIDVPNGNGLDGTDILTFNANVDGTGFPATADLEINGNLNADWGYSDGTGVASTTAGTPISYSPAGGEHRTADGYSYIQLTVPNGSSNVALQVNAINNSLGEAWCIDDVELYGCLIPPCTDLAPTTQASLITFSSVTSSSMTVSWTNGNGSGRIVIIDTINSFTNPVNGTDPIANSVYGGGEQVVYNGTGNSVTITGLSDSTVYWFRVYEYNCSADSIKFNTSTATDNPLSDTTLPIVYGSCVSIFSDDFEGTLAQWSNTADWTIDAGELRHNFASGAGSSYSYADITAQDFSTENFEWTFCVTNTWDPSTSNNFDFFLFSDTTNLFGLVNGYSVGVNRIGSSDFITLYRWDAGVATAVITGTVLWNAANDVCIRVTRSSTGDWELFSNFNGSGEASEGTGTDATYSTGQYIGPTFTFTSTRANKLWFDDINICKEPVPPCSDPEPTIQATNIVFSGITENSMTISWTKGNGAGRVVLINTISSFTSPADGIDPVANPIYSGGQQVVYNDTGSTVTITGLSPSTQYCFRVYEYSCDSAQINFNVNTGTNNPLCDTTTTLSACTSIFSDNFSAGLGAWSNTTDWQITAGELASNDLSGLAATIYTSADIGAQNYSTFNYEWQFCMSNGNWDPSTSTNFEFVLYSSLSNLFGATNGYSVGVVRTGSTDELRLYRLDGGAHVSLVTLALGTFDWNALDDVCIRVTRTSTGDWELFYDPNGSGETSAGTATDATYTSGQFTGPVYEHSATRGVNNFFVDDINICRESTGPCSDPAPTLQDSLITFANVTGTSMDVSWTNGNGTGRIVVINTSNSFTNPTNGVDPVANSVYSGSGEQVVYNGSGSTVSVTGLSSSTPYWFRVYAYNCFGDSIKFNMNTATDNPNTDTTSYMPGVATSLTFRAIPTVCMEADSLFGVKVCAVDSGGYLDTSYNDLTALTIYSQPGGATLSGNLIKTASQGCVVFDSLSLDVTGDYTLSSTNGSISGISDTISVGRNCIGQSIWEGLIINEFSNGTSGEQEYYEFLVAGQCGQAVDIRGFILDDNNGTFSVDWTAPGSGVAQGHFRFKDTPHWALIPVGSIIVIYNADDPNPNLPPDDPYDSNNDSLYVVPHNNTILFEYCSTRPVAQTDTGYSCSYVTTNNWSGLGIANTADAVQVRSPDGTYFHGVSYGNATVVNGGPDSLHVSTTSGGGKVFYFNDLDYRDVANWSYANISGTNETPGDFNNALNEAWVRSLRDVNAATCPIQQPFVLKAVQFGSTSNHSTSGLSTSVTNVILYPNPSRDGILNLDLVAFEDTEIRVMIYDMFGRVVKEHYFVRSADTANNTLTLETHGVSSGMYVVEIASENNIFRKKIEILNY